jgi:hypothetical protein
MNLTITHWLNTLVPMSHIIAIVDQVLPAFIVVAFLILAIGYYLGIIGSETVFAPSGRLIVLFACIAGAPWMLAIGQEIANALVESIADADPALNWLVVNNPSTNSINANTQFGINSSLYDSSLALNFEKPFDIISQYMTAKTGPSPGIHLDKWPDYIMRCIFIFLTGLVACFTEFVMQAMLVIQKLIMVFSKLLIPIWIACLSLPSAQGSAQNFLKSVLGVMCWPVGWAIVHVGTMAAFQALQPPSFNAQLGELILSCATLGVVCLWPVVGTIAAPFLIAKMVTSGSNFAQGMVGAFSSAAGQHAARGLQSGARVTGALVGGMAAGPAGAAAGAMAGGKIGEAMAAPVVSATESAEGVNEGRRAIPSSRSAKAADAAIGLIKARS